MNKAKQHQYDAKYLITAYIRDECNDMVLSDLINIIFMYFHQIFHFEVIPITKEFHYGISFKISETDNVLNKLDTYDIDWNDECSAIVVTMDSEAVYVGISGDDHPILIIPNIITIKNKQILIGHELNNDKCNLISSIRPYQYAEIKNFDAFKQLFLKIFSKNKDKIPRLLLSESVPFLDGEKITKFAFEELKCDNFYLKPRSVLSLYASSGNMTGIVMHSDYESTEFVPVCNGICLRNISKKIQFGKRDIIEYLEVHKHDDNVDEKLELFLFFNKFNIHKQIVECAKKTVNGMTINRSDLYGNIILSGINTFYKNLAKRLEDEIFHLDGSICMHKIKVIAPPERHFSPWIGGSILCCLTTFETKWISKKDYQKQAISIAKKAAMLWI
eukprot:486108_1